MHFLPLFEQKSISKLHNNARNDCIEPGRCIKQHMIVPLLLVPASALAKTELPQVQEQYLVVLEVLAGEAEGAVVEKL